jgi:anion-transporting  ArsA/GET3 family ATPase
MVKATNGRLSMTPLNMSISEEKGVV